MQISELNTRTRTKKISFYHSLLTFYSHKLLAYCIWSKCFLFSRNFSTRDVYVLQFYYTPTPLLGILHHARKILSTYLIHLLQYMNYAMFYTNNILHY